MATSGIVRFAKREPGVSFSEHPNDWQAQFYVHYDGNVENSDHSDNLFIILLVASLVATAVTTILL